MSDFLKHSAFKGKSIHCIGAKGAGMAALAEVFVGLGAKVTGSDTGETFFTDAILKRLGVVPKSPFAAENIPADTDMVVYSTAYAKETNAELAAAFGLGIPVMSYPEAIGKLTKEKLSLLVTGTHGKTTTSAMLGEVLRVAGKDPLAVIGSKVLDWDRGALSGNGEYFVLEADEYQNKLRLYHPHAVILTSLDWDHPDFFPDLESYIRVFQDFVKRIPRHGVLVYWGDSAAVADIAKEATCKKVSYGFLPGSDYRAGEYVPVIGGAPDGVRQSFSIIFGQSSLGTFELALAGKHNALNATAVVALCDTLKVDSETVRTALRGFRGTARRFEFKGECRGALIYDDYAHHPEEISVTLRAFRDLYPDRHIIALFHPHTYSRTAALLSEFSQSFGDADEVRVLDIYGSAREAVGTVSSADLVREINRYEPKKAECVGAIDTAYDDLVSRVGKNDLVVTFGAGNVWEVAERLVKNSSQS